MSEVDRRDLPFATLAYTRSEDKWACEILVSGRPVALLAVQTFETFDKWDERPTCRVTLPLEYVDAQTLTPGPRP